MILPQKHPPIYLITAYTYRVYTLILFAFAAFLCFSCSDKINGSNKKYFDDAIEKVDADARAKGAYSPASMAYLDSVFAHVKGAGIIHLAKRYVRKTYSNSDYSKKALYADSAIGLLQPYQTRDENVALLYAEALSIRGNLYFDVKSYDNAIQSFTLLKIALTKVKDTCRQQLYYDNMAHLLYAQKKYLNAARFFRMRYLFYETCNYQSTPFLTFLNVQENIDNTGICYFKAGMVDSAAYYYDSTLNYVKHQESAFLPQYADNLVLIRGVVYANQAEIFFLQKKYSEAESLFLKSIEGTKKDDKGFTNSTRLTQLQMYIEVNRIKDAGLVIDTLTTTLDTSAINPAVVTFFKLKSDYYLKKNRPYNAYSTLVHSFAVRDSIERRDREFNRTDVGKELENTEQRAVNEKLKKENEVQTAYLIVALVIAVMAAVVVLLVLSNLRRKSRYVKKLLELNNEVNNKNEALLTTLSALEQSHKENDRLMRVVAHDLKNPVSAIRTLVYSLLKKEQPPATKESLELIQATCTDSISLIKDLLNNSHRLSNGKELVDIGRLIEQCIELFQAKASEKKQLINVKVEHTVVMLNRQKILRVIGNILNNAIKFSPENTTIDIRLENKENKVLFSVKDYGIGIPRHLKDMIFTVDAAISRTGTAGEESHGMGLSISRQIIQEHNGRLWFESEEGKGSVFYVELPLPNIK